MLIGARIVADMIAAGPADDDRRSLAVRLGAARRRPDVARPLAGAARRMPPLAASPPSGRRRLDQRRHAGPRRGDAGSGRCSTAVAGAPWRRRGDRRRRRERPTRPRTSPGRAARRSSSATPLPVGWVGKAWALQQGLEAAGGEWSCSRCRHPPVAAFSRALVARMVADGLDLLTVGGRFDCPTAPVRWLTRRC